MTEPTTRQKLNELVIARVIDFEDAADILNLLEGQVYEVPALAKLIDRTFQLMLDRFTPGAVYPGRLPWLEDSSEKGVRHA